MNSRDYPWYDSVWLSAYHQARATIAARAPGRLGDFDQALSIFRTRPAFKPCLLDSAFDADTLDDIRRATAALAPAQLELHEARSFRRFVVHDHPLFNALQQRIVDRVGEAVGEAVEASYNFLSLYGPLGVCPLHLDAPLAKWTLDLCIDQSDAWPIYFSPIVGWPRPGDYAHDWEDRVKREFAGAFTAHSLEPGQAVVFSGSSQWHYRDAMPGTGAKKFCDLLFFHFVPRGTLELSDPANWARLFGIPELAREARPAVAA
jgi:hypothetical protein